MDVAATALVEMLDAPASMSGTVFHIAHPRPASGGTLFGHAGTLLGLPLVSHEEWLGRLKGANTGEVEAQMRIPALALLDFFEDSLGADGALVLSTERASAASRALREVKGLDESAVESWVKYWRKIGFLDA